MNSDSPKQDLLLYRQLIFVALGQRLLIFGILLETLSVIFFFVLNYLFETKALELEDSIASGLIVSCLIGLGVGILVAFLGFILAMQHIFASNERIIFLLLFWLPAINLVFLLFVNLRATKELKRHGAEIGFFGAKLSSIKKPDPAAKASE